MIAIRKTIYETENEISKALEEIVIQGMLEESNFKIDITDLNELQADWIAEFVNPKSKVVHLNGPRVSGRTSFGIGMILATSLFNHNAVSLVIVDNNIACQHVYQKTLDYLRIFCENNNLPELIKTRSRDKIEFINGSKILFSKNIVKGFSLRAALLDLASSTNMESLDEELISSLYPCFNNDGKLIITLGG